MTSFEFSDKKLLDDIILELVQSEFKLVEKTKDYYNFMSNNDIIEIFLHNKYKEGCRIDISLVIHNDSKTTADKKI